MLAAVGGFVEPTGAAAGHDWIIVPGVRVGPVTQKSKERDLRKAFGSRNVAREMMNLGEGYFEPVLVVYGKDPAKTLTFIDGDIIQSAKIWICRGNEGAHPCLWRTTDGIGFGTTLVEPNHEWQAFPACWVRRAR